jgi:hypothetical protein
MASSRAATGKYLGMSATDLAALKTQYEAARTAILTGGQAYTRPGLSITRATLSEISDELAEIYYALNVNTGGIVRETLISF